MAAGVLTLAVIVAMGYYLIHESQYAFKRKFTYGFRFALQPTEGEFEREIPLDPNASVLTVHTEGAEGMDEKEEGIEMPTLEALAGTAALGTGTALTGDLEKVDAGRAEGLFRDDWRSPKSAEEGDRFLLFGFATPEYKFDKMVLAWVPDEGADPNEAPYDLRLRLRRGPDGADVPAIDVDLRKTPSGRIELPVFVAKSDAERTRGYVFEVVATPTRSNAGATAAGFFGSEWGPTLAHPRYGFFPLLASTLLITLLALLIAAPIAVGAAIYVSEIAPRRLREWLKPIIELLASVPTVVLGYFGLMLLAPGLMKIVPEAAGMQSGRAMITAAIMMAILLIPIIMTIAEDTLRSVPLTLRDGGIALGLTQEETIKRVLMPAAKAGLSAAILLGFSRAVGETMIVWILSGGTPNLPNFNSLGQAVKNFFEPTRGMADTIAIEMGNVAFEEQHYGHLFLLGLSLFVLTLAINLLGFRLRRQAWPH